YNNKVIHLYWAAYSLFQPSLKPYLMEVHVKDSLKFFGPGKPISLIKYTPQYDSHEAWAKDNLFCYELILPERCSDTLFARYMLQDLNRFFGYRTEILKKPIACTMLKVQKQHGLVQTATPDAYPYIMFKYPKLIAV